jgi:plasmid stabilization system protein ParE
MTGYDFHPEAALDLDEIWELIAEASLDAADAVVDCCGNARTPQPARDSRDFTGGENNRRLNVRPVSHLAIKLVAELPHLRN